jgi:hypothetical protein
MRGLFTLLLLVLLLAAKAVVGTVAFIWSTTA